MSGFEFVVLLALGAIAYSVFNSRHMLKQHREQSTTLAAKLDALQRTVRGPLQVWRDLETRERDKKWNDERNALIEQGEERWKWAKEQTENQSSRLAVIEQAQGVLCERLDKIMSTVASHRLEDGPRYDKLLLMAAMQWDTLSKKLDEVRGHQLLSDFRKHAKPPAKRKGKR